MSGLPVAIIAAALTFPTWLQSQEAPKANGRPQAPVARAQDVDTIDNIIQALYQVISGPAGQKRDWDRFRSLFVPGGRLVPVVAQQSEKPVARILDVEDYIRRANGFFEKEGFWESEKERKTEISGNLVHAFSTYESRHEQTGQPFQIGVNSIQLYSDGTRWWIVTVMWNSKR